MTPAMGYAEMKDSGIEWVGKIPVEWKEMRLRYCTYIRARLGWKALKADEYVDEGYPLLSAFNIINDKLDFTLVNYINQFRYDESPEIKINVGDVLLLKDGAGIGKCAYVDKLPMASTVNGSIALLTAVSHITPKYLYYYFLSPVFQKFIDRLKMGMGVPHLFQSDIKNIRILVPPISEQSAIAAYLDTQCAKIDEIIAEAKASIEDYKQWKASVIYEAVTKGLDPNVEMKESGIEWIGEIPKEWKLRKLFKCFALIGSGTTPKSQIEDYYAGNISWLQSGDINGSIVKTTAKHINKKALEDYSALRIYGAPFIAIAMYGASIANTSIVVIDACTNQACCVLSLPKLGIDYKYMFYAVLSSKAELLIQARGGTQPNISQEIIKQLRVPIPPMREQTAIAAYLDAQCAKIDELSTEKQSLIADLEAYKKSLIYEVVTGKRRVC